MDNLETPPWRTQSCTNEWTLSNTVRFWFPEYNSNTMVQKRIEHLWFINMFHFFHLFSFVFQFLSNFIYNMQPFFPHMFFCHQKIGDDQRLVHGFWRHDQDCKKMILAMLPPGLSSFQLHGVTYPFGDVENPTFFLGYVTFTVFFLVLLFFWMFVNFHLFPSFLCNWKMIATTWTKPFSDGLSFCWFSKSVFKSARPRQSLCVPSDAREVLQILVLKETTVFKLQLVSSSSCVLWVSWWLTMFFFFSTEYLDLNPWVKLDPHCFGNWKLLEFFQ